MIEPDFEWLAERAYSGNPSERAYTLGETYLGERADLVRELRTALAGCPKPYVDTFAAMMQQAVDLNALPVLRAVVALWRDAYRDLLDEIGTSPRSLDGSTALSGQTGSHLLLTTAEQARLTAFKRGLKRR